MRKTVFFAVLLVVLAVPAVLYWTSARQSDTQTSSVHPVPANAPLVDDGPCTVEPLAAIHNPEALAFETGDRIEGAVDRSHLTHATFRALEKFEQKVLSFGGTLKLTSAYRPPAYQEHLRDVWMKWVRELRDNHQVSCQPLRAQVESEFERHGLLETQPPVVSSDHTRGTAFDAKVEIPSDAVIKTVKLIKSHGKRKKETIAIKVTVDKLAKVCGLFRPVPVKDRVHFRLAS